MEKMKRRRPAEQSATRRSASRAEAPSMDGDLIPPKPRIAFQIIDETNGAFGRRQQEAGASPAPKGEAPRRARSSQPSRPVQPPVRRASKPRRRIGPMVLGALAVVCLGGAAFVGIRAMTAGQDAMASADPQAVLTADSYRLPTALSVEPMDNQEVQEAQGVSPVSLDDPEEAGFFETESTTAGEAPAGVSSPTIVDNEANTATKLEQWSAFNSDIKGWLTVPGTNIDYPVCWASDINYYLSRGYDKGYSHNGVVWTNPETTFGTASQISPNTVLYGHNWTNYSANPRIGSPNDVMFGQLTAFHHLSFAQQHPFIYYTTKDGGTMTFKIFAAFYTELAFDYINAAGGQYILDGALARSRHDYHVDVNTNDKIVTLSTCTRAYGKTSNQRFVVMARLLRDGESAGNDNITDNPGHKEPNVWG